jgi:hypothetical protein
MSDNGAQSRYNKVIKHIAEHLVEFQTLLAERPEIAGLEEAIKVQAEVRDELEVMSAIKAELEKRHDWLRTVVTPARMDERGITTVTVAGIGRVTLQDDVFVSVPAEARTQTYTWFDDRGFGDLVTRTINGSTLAAWVRKRIKTGDELPPPELVKVTPYTRAQITRVTGK